MPEHARLVEVFSSIQGESELIGYRQIFIRFFGCNLRCAYCDSPEAVTGSAPARCRVERTPGRGDFAPVANPLSPPALCAEVARLNAAPHHSLSLTGGEPLLHAAFLAEFLPLARALGLPIYLETNGTLADALARVLDQIDVIGMDLKLPAVTGGADLFAAHREFLALAHRRRVFVKIIAAADLPPAELETAARLLAAVDPAIPVTLQPVTPCTPETRAPTAAALLDLQALALRHLRTVRVIPQAHKLMGVL